MKRLLLLILAVGLLFIVGANHATEPTPPPVDSSVRFVPVHVYIDPQGKALACYQLTVLASKNAMLVGVEGGESAAFEKAPYYDPKALQGQRIIIGAYDVGSDLPSGKTRVATLMFRVKGAPLPEFAATLDVAGGSDGSAINATASLVPVTWARSARAGDSSMLGGLR